MATRERPWPAGTPSWVDLAVDDPAEAAGFYGPLFGWEFADAGDGTGSHLVAHLGGRVAAGIGPKRSRVAPAQWSTYLAAADADTTAETVLAAGGALLTDVVDVRANCRRFVAAAPDGSTFGVWQARERIGTEVTNEPGSLAWSELHSRDLEGARAFYAAVFPLTYHDLSGPEFTYFLLNRADDDEAVGGMCTAAMLADRTPSTWLTWFGATSCDEAAVRVVDLGGSILMPPSDSPFGRMAVVAGAQEERFGLLDTATVGR